MCRGGDDDREGAWQEPDRPLRRRRARASGRGRGSVDARRPLGCAHEDAAESRRQAQPAQRRAPDRSRHRHGAPLAHRLPQLPRVDRRRRRRDPDCVRRPVHLGDAGAARDPRLQGRPGDHRPRRGHRRVAADRRRSQLRVRARASGHGRHRRVTGRRAPDLRDACRRRDRDLQARPQPVRRGRHAPPRSARRPRRCRARERRSLRIRPAGGRARDRAARIQPPALERRRHGCGRRPDRRAVGPHPRLASCIGLVPGGFTRRDQSAGDPRLQRPRPRAPGADALRP